MSRLTFGHLGSVQVPTRQKLLDKLTFSYDDFWSMTHNCVFSPPTSTPTPALLLRITWAALQTKWARCSVYPRARLGAPFHTPFIGSGLGELCKQGRQPEMNIQTPDLSAFIRQLTAFGMMVSLHLKKCVKSPLVEAGTITI